MFDRIREQVAKSEVHLTYLIDARGIGMTECEDVLPHTLRKRHGVKGDELHARGGAVSFDFYCGDINAVCGGAGHEAYDTFFVFLSFCIAFD